MAQLTRRLYISDGPVSVVAPRIGPVHLKVMGRAGVLLETVMTGVRGVELTNSAQPSGQTVELRGTGKGDGQSVVAKPPSARPVPAAPKTAAHTKSQYHRNVTVVGKDIEVRLDNPGERGHVSWRKHKALVVGNNNPFVEGKFVVRVKGTSEVYSEVNVPGSYLSGFNKFFETHTELKGGEKLVFTRVADVTVKDSGTGKNVKRPCYDLRVVGSAPAQRTVSITLPPAKKAKSPSWGAHYGVLVVPAAVKPFFPKPKADFVIRDASTKHVVRIPDGYISGLTAFFKAHPTLKVGDELVFRKESDVVVKGDTYPCVSVKIVKH